jgi:hypothetical protein
MKIGQLLRLNPFVILLGFYIFISSLGCNSSNNGCKQIETLFNGKEISSDLLGKYMHATSSQVLMDNESTDDVRVYVDKSSGINEAFSSKIGGKAKELLIAIAGQKNVKYFSVLQEISPEFIEGAPTNYYDKASNYHPTESASLEKALKTITENNGLSFFITDGEEFDSKGEEANKEAWAQLSMENWIKKGNSIHFWITDFQVRNKAKKEITKHLFFMAFVPLDMKSEKSFQDLVRALNDINPVHLELSNTSWQVLKPDWPEQSTGLDPNLLKEGVFERNIYLRNFENASGSYEFMSIQLPIKSEVLTVPGALTKPQFYRDLYINLSNNKFFDISKLDIEVTEISKDLNMYAQFDEITSNQPNTVKDPSTNKTILDPESLYSCFYELKDDKPFLKSDYEYTKNYENSLKELFQFDEEIFKNSLKDDNLKVELGMRFHKNFNEGDQKLSNDYGYNIVRVDFKIAEFVDKSFSERSYFTWESMWKPSEENTGLGKSIEQVIKSTEPKGKIIHTLFIKFIKA